MNPNRLFTVTAAASALALSACSDTNNSTPQQPIVVQNQVALTAVGSCAELETYLEDSVIEQMNVHLDSLKEGHYGWWGWFGGGPAVLEGATDDFARAPTPASGDSDSGDAPTDYTETNNQVEGVDEADFVKTNGTHIFVLSGQKLYMVKSWPAESMTMTASVSIDGYPSQMLLDDAGNVVVFSYFHPSYDTDALYWCNWGCGNRVMTKVTVLSTADDTLDVIHQVYLHGSYADARGIDTSVRVIMRDYVAMPEGVRWYPENFAGNPGDNKEAWEAAIEATKASNAALIRAQTLDDWVPEDYYADGEGNRITLPRDCQSFSRSNAPVRMGIATVGTINITGGNVSLSKTSVLGEVGEIYASADALYIANFHWWWWPQDNQRNHTYFHKFDISNPNRAVYSASGVVDGYPLNQFAMDEHDGYFRVATTIDEWKLRDGAEGPWDFDFRTYNRVTVFAEQDGALSEVGRTRDLAERERITAARFIGDKGYLVTFEQIDPLFTLDLSNPAEPSILGELKIPGFSSYLHPLDENHLLAIGVDLPEPDENGFIAWNQRSMKLSIFDVSDMTQPTEKFVELVGTAYGWSEATWDHKAFNYFGARSMLAIPFSDFSPGTDGDAYWESFVSDLRLFHIDAANGISARGSVSMRDVLRTESGPDWYYAYSPWVRRGVMATSETDDYAYAISDGGIRAVNMANPDQPLSTVVFDHVTHR